MELLLAEKSTLLVIPYLAPWSWMNVPSVLYTNWLVEEIFRLFDLPQDTRIISTGFSMGGLAALVYPMFANREIAGVVANSPVCNLLDNFLSAATCRARCSTRLLAIPTAWRKVSEAARPYTGLMP